MKTLKKSIAIWKVQPMSPAEASRRGTTTISSVSTVDSLLPNTAYAKLATVRVRNGSRVVCVRVPSDIVARARVKSIER